MTIKTLARLTFLAMVLMFAPGVAAAAQGSAFDPPRDAAHPARNQQLLIPSRGVGLNALLFQAAGAGQHPTVILMHGLPAMSAISILRRQSAAAAETC